MNLAKQNPVKTTKLQLTEKSLRNPSFTKDAPSLAPIVGSTACNGKREHGAAHAAMGRRSRDGRGRRRGADHAVRRSGCVGAQRRQS